MRSLFILIVFVCALPIASFGGTIDALQRTASKEVQDFTLQAVNATEQAAYLGVPAEKAFMLSEIDAKVVLIQIFSMYCPHCQAEAPHMNDFYAMLKASPQGKKLKMLGVGAGNTQFEVDYFREKFAVAFPLFSDENYEALDILAGDVGTPYYMLVRLSPKGKEHKVLYRKEGRIAEVKDFFDTVVKKSGLK